MLSRPLSFGRKGTGTIFAYEGSITQSINAGNQYHAMIGLGEGDTSEGTTFLASTSGAIANTANNGGVLRCTDVSHGLTTGQYITLNGMGDASHVGTTRVTVIDADTFDCDDIVYSSISDTGFWQRGTSLTVDSGYSGRYSLDFSCTLSSAANNKNFKIELVKNTTDLDEIVGERKVAIQNDLGNMSAAGVIEVVDGDVLWVKVECTTDATNMVVEHANMHLE